MFVKTLVVALLVTSGICKADESNGSRLGAELWGIITDVPHPDIPATTGKFLKEVCSSKFKGVAPVLARCIQLVTDLEYRGDEITNLFEQVKQASQRDDKSHEENLLGELADEAASYRKDFAELNKLLFSALPREQGQSEEEHL